MTPDELVRAAEARVADAEKNIASCVDVLNEHSAQRGGVPNSEVLALAHAQAALGQACATLAMVKTVIAAPAERATAAPTTSTTVDDLVGG